MFSEKFLKYLVFCAGISILFILAGIVVTLCIQSFPSIKQFGLSFFYSQDWNPVTGSYGALPFLVGTLLTSFLAVVISIPFSLAVAILLSEYFKEGIVSQLFRSLVELLAGIPSVVFGFWGLMVFVPIMREFEIKFGILPYGVGIMTSSIILAMMIIPYSASLAREMINLVPTNIKEAAVALGATKLEVIWKVILPYARSSIFAGFMLSLGRALGETMAVTMVIGNRNSLPDGLFGPGNTMASLIANEFAEATDDLYLSALIEIALVLFIVTTLINILGKYITRKMTVRTS
jgi:phosphate transport system permease protein